VAWAQPSYPWFAWIERNGQKMLWRAVQDAVRAQPPVAGGAEGPATLMLDPRLRLPDWYTDWDIHIRPDGVWRDEASAETYELGAKIVMLGVSDDCTIHRAFTETAVPQRDRNPRSPSGCARRSDRAAGRRGWPGDAPAPRRRAS
jgi:hypothetical protein